MHQRNLIVPMDFPSDNALQKLRSDFSFLESGTIYLNHASVSPLSGAVVRAITDHLGTRSFGQIETYETDLRVIAECKSLIARLISATSPHRVALTCNTSDALNIVASGLDWKPGDRVLLSDLEFPGNVYPFLNLRRHGVELDVVPSEGGRMPTDRLLAGIQAKTRVLAVSAVQFLSGYRADLAAIGEACRRHQVHFIVDGIQSVGALKIDVQAMKIDALAVGAQKWMMGPLGTGFLYVASELQERLHQAYLGWLAVQDPFDFFNHGQELAAGARRYEGGTPNVPGLHGLRVAVRTLLEIGPDMVEAHIVDLTDLLIQKLQNVGGVEMYSPTERHERGGIITVRLPQTMSTQLLYDALSARKLKVSLRHGMLRFSPHCYNTSEEIDIAASIVRESMNRI